MPSKYTGSLLALICVFKADAAVSAMVVFFSSPEVKTRSECVLAGDGREGISPVGVFVTHALCRLSPAGCSAFHRHWWIKKNEILCFFHIQAAGSLVIYSY